MTDLTKTRQAIREMNDGGIHLPDGMAQNIISVADLKALEARLTASEEAMRQTLHNWDHDDCSNPSDCGFSALHELSDALKEGE